jgi:diguanylate cyclase (GGDEF)-like protein
MKSAIAKIASKNTVARQFMLLVMPVAVLFVATVAIALLQTVRHTNEVEAERTQLAVEAAVGNLVKSVADYTYDNGYWDEAALALYRPEIDRTFLDQTWGAATEDATYLTKLAVIDSQGNTVIAYDSGEESGFDPFALLGPALQQLQADVRVYGRASSGVVVTTDGMMMIAALADIEPSNRKLDRLVPITGPSQLIMLRRITPNDIIGIGRALQLDGLTLAEPRSGMQSAVIRDVLGRKAGSLAWRPAHSGVDALIRSLPIILLVSAIHLLLAGIAVRRGYKWLDQLGVKAMQDSLTNLPNRRAFLHALRRHQREGNTVALALLDLDGFKAINDHYGHHIGDELIKSSAAELQTLAIHAEVVARLGGDEFAILYSGDHGATHLEAAAAAIVKRFDEPVLIGERRLVTGASLGLADADLSVIDVAEALRRADIAMYAAKRSGKRRLVWHGDDLDAERAEEGVIADALAAALDASEFTVLYQPTVDARTSRIVSVEALVRWTSASLGEVAPTTFLPIADRTGIITHIATEVLRAVERDGAAWPGIRLSVNMSRAQLRTPDFVPMLAKRLRDSSIDPTRLDLEIRETLFLAEPEFAQKLAFDVRRMGIGLTLDSFGSESGALNVLRMAEFTRVKLDPRLVQRSATDDAARVMLQGCVAYAHALGIKAVALGIESHTHAELMRLAGCDELQGWSFGRPVQADEITAMLGTPQHAARSRKSA